MHYACPSNYLSAPSLNWDAMLKMTKTELKHIPDPDIYILFEKVKRGRTSYILIDIAKSTINI